MTEYIEIRGARENNLKDVTLRIPKRRITIFTGVSGSGKSSVVFDTIATEAQRQLFENFSYFVRNFLPSYPQPQADSIENLSMAVIVDLDRRHDHRHLHAAAPAVLADRPAPRRLRQRLLVQ
jgi:excinuclease UvrABC ATPase subunit